MSAPVSANEQRLLRAAQRGGHTGRAAFDELVKRHQARVVRLMRHLLGPAEAEDVAQEAFVRAYLALDRIQAGAPVWPWLRTIATRLAYNRRRDRKTRKSYEDRIEAHCGAMDTTGNRQAILRVFDKLSYPYREVLVLRYVEELSIEEIAKSLGLGVSAAKMRISRARAEFKEIHERLTK